MPKEKKQKDIQLPILPSLYSILPSTSSTSTLTSSNHSPTLTGGKDQSKQTSKELKELEFWLERSDLASSSTSTSTSGGNCRGVLEKILGLEIEKDENDKKADLKRVTRRETWKVEESFNVPSSKRKDKRGGKKDRKGKGKEIEVEEEEGDMMELDDQVVNSIRKESESDTSIDHESGAESSLSDDDRPRKRRREQVRRPRRKPGRKPGRKVESVARDLPEFEVPEVDIPNDLPLGDLLHSLHTYASQKFTSNYSLLPPLSLSNPYPSQSQTNHFTSLQQKQQEAEQISSLLLSLPEWNQFKFKNWEIKNNKGFNKRIWNNVERGFDSSVLMILGYLVLELIEKEVEGRREKEKGQREEIRREGSRSGSGSFDIWNKKDVEESDDESGDTEIEEEEEEEESGNSSTQRRRRKNQLSRSESLSTPNLSSQEQQPLSEQSIEEKEQEVEIKKQLKISEREAKLLATRMEKAIKYREGLEAAKIRKEERDERVRRADSRREGTFDTVNGGEEGGEGEEMFRKKSTTKKKSPAKKEFKSVEFIEDSDEEL